MSNFILKTRCSKGHIIIYEDKVTIGYDQFGVEDTETIARSQIIGVDVKTTHASIFGVGGRAKVTFNTTGGKTIEAKLVKIPDAKHIKTLLT